MRNTFVSGVLGLAVSLSVVGCGGEDPETEYQAAMRADLLRLADAQEFFFDETGSYSTEIADLGFVPSESVFMSIRYIRFPPTQGWGAEASHALSGNHCAMYVGGAELSFTERWPGILPDRPTCKPLPPPGPK